MATSLDFKALMSAERAKLRRDEDGKSGGATGEEDESVAFGLREPLDWERDAVACSVEGIYHTPGTVRGDGGVVRGDSLSMP